MSQKKLMLLGGIRYLLPVIEAAHKLGYWVITVDYIPDNIAHKYSDEYHNVSILDKEAVLQLAQELNIDGILSFAVDPGVVTAAYVAEKIGLPFACSYLTACILQDKVYFRKFLSDNHFNTPIAKGYTAIEDILDDQSLFNWPVMVKPADSAGSKGVTKVDSPNKLENAATIALEAAHNGQFIVEEYLEKEGLSSGCECFFQNGELVFNGFYDQYFDTNAANPFTPSAECWPSDKPARILDEVKSELQRLGSLLCFRTGIFNVEWRVCTNGKIYLMEVSPRAGGNRLAEILRIATGVDLIEAEVKKALGEDIPIIREPPYQGCYAIQVLHSTKKGQFERLELDTAFEEEYIIEKEIRVNKGDQVGAFTGANSAVGTLFLKSESRQDMDRVLCQMDNLVTISVR